MFRAKSVFWRYLLHLPFTAENYGMLGGTWQNGSSEEGAAADTLCNSSRHIVQPSVLQTLTRIASLVTGLPGGLWGVPVVDPNHPELPLTTYFCMNECHSLAQLNTCLWVRAGLCARKKGDQHSSSQHTKLNYCRVCAPADEEGALLKILTCLWVLKF